jgi:putative transcriptional regulator
MRIVVTLDVMLARRKMRAKDLALRVGITEANLSLLRTGKVKGVRFETLAKICEELRCKPGDILDVSDGDEAASAAEAVGEVIAMRKSTLRTR